MHSDIGKISSRIENKSNFFSANISSLNEVNKVNKVITIPTLKPLQKTLIATQNIINNENSKSMLSKYVTMSNSKLKKSNNKRKEFLSLISLGDFLESNEDLSLLQKNPNKVFVSNDQNWPVIN